MVDGRYHSFISKRKGRVLKATEDQRISKQVWRIPCKKISINTLKESQKKLQVLCKGGLFDSRGNREIHPSKD